MPRAHRSPRSAAPGPRQQPSRNPRRNFDANKNSGNSRAFLQHADAAGSFARCRARCWRHPGARTRACPQAEKNFSRHAPFRHRTRANAQNCANFFALFGACERACAAPRTASRRRRRCRCSVRMSAHAPHRHITHTRPDAPRFLSPTRPLPRACSPRPTRSTAHARHGKHTRPKERDAAGRCWPQRSERCCDRQMLGRCFARGARLRCTSPSLPKNRREVRRVPLPLQRRRLPARGDHVVRVDACGAAGTLGLACRIRRPLRRPSRSHSPLRRQSDMPSARAPDRQTSRTIESALRFPLPPFLYAAQTKTGRTRRPVRLSRSGARLSGRLPRAARRSRPASAVRSTAPGRRSPARRSNLRHRRPR